MNQESEASERALPLQACHEVVRERDALERGAEHELPGMKDERLGVAHLHELSQVVHRLLHVDERIPRVPKDAEEAIDADVHARRLHQPIVEGIDADRAVLDEPTDRAV